MTFSVYHVLFDVVLNLSEPDLGHPELPGLWELLRQDKRPVPERGLQCLQCKEERPDCPEWMHLNERDGVRFASHYNNEIRDHPSSNESDKHKAFKERVANAASLAGHVVEMENRASHGRRRTDVLIKGAGGLQIGWEVQLSPITASTVRKRSKIARADGITPLWSTTSPTAHLIDQAPWARTDDLSWREIANGRELLVRGGVRELRMEVCDYRNPLPCPVRGHGRCGKRHGTWELMLGVQLDDLARGSAAGEFVPILVPKRGGYNRMWVHPADRDMYADSIGGLPSEDDAEPRRSRASAVEMQPRPVDPECRYGQDSGYRSDPAVVRDDGQAIGASSVTLPSLNLPAPPPRACIRPGHCSAGTGPCGAPARFYACGWRCEVHAP